MTRRLTLFALLALAAFGDAYPRKAGVLTLHTLQGPKTLSQFKGKLVVVAFIQTTCQHCLESTKILNQIQNDYAAKGVQILQGAFNPEAEAGLPAFVRQYKQPYPVGLISIDDVVTFAGIAETDRPTSPVLLVVDKNGNIRSRYFGRDAIFQGDQNKNIRAEIEKYLK
jgi:cytochrome oxidase Cu insertion factor (SCO1/SenC/PrrC family)